MVTLSQAISTDQVEWAHNNVGGLCLAWPPDIKILISCAMGNFEGWFPLRGPEERKNREFSLSNESSSSNFSDYIQDTTMQKACGKISIPKFVKTGSGKVKMIGTQDLEDLLPKTQQISTSSIYNKFISHLFTSPPA